MPLADRAIKKLIEENKLLIDPAPGKWDWQAMTVDVHLGKLFFQVKHRGQSGHLITIDLKDYKSVGFAEQFQEPLELVNDQYAMRPGEFVLAYTAENLIITKEAGVCAFVEGKSSLARIGLGVHITAPTIHPGFGEKSEGRGQPIMLEMFNHSQNIIVLRPGVPIGQFRFEEIQGLAESSGAKTYGNGQPGAA